MTAPSHTLQQNVQLQEQSPLFSLPAEIRSQIFSCALTDYEDVNSDKAYNRNTYWYRPGYQAKRRTATELLRTCKRVFQETWFLPFALAEHSFYLTSVERAPKNRVTPERMKKYLNLLRKFARDQDGMDIPPIQSIRVFSQLWALEEATRLQEILDIEGFMPQNVTITIRYTDFWYWENDRPLHIDAKWVNKVRFPESVSTIKMDFEIIDRRLAELDFIVDEAMKKWFFRGVDGTIFQANKEDITTYQWTGSSVFDGQRRWLINESRPNEIDYHVKTVTWKPVSKSDVRVDDIEAYSCPNLDIPADFPRDGKLHSFASVGLEVLEASMISPNTIREYIWDMPSGIR